MDKCDFRTEDEEPSENRSSAAACALTTRKIFVVPEISVPVDVLEATTFFQGVDSGIIS